jgi:alkylated DNA repair dioxygenase AlkB
VEPPSAQWVFEHRERRTRVTYHPDFLAPCDADALFEWMQRHAPWQAEAPVVFGAPRPVRRESCAFGLAGTTYRYSGLDRVALAWPALVEPIVARLTSEFGLRFDFGLCNRYPDGDAALGRHADDERDIAPNSAIAGLSLGATRDFALYERGGARVALQPLAHGSLLVMWGATQRFYQHAIPRRRRVRTPRISITFRSMAARVRPEPAADGT